MRACKFLVEGDNFGKILFFYLLIYLFKGMKENSMYNLERMQKMI